MALGIYQGALKEFDAALFEIRKYLDFVVMANKVRGFVGKVLNWPALVGEQKDDIQSFMKNNEYRPEVGFNVLVIGVSTAYENLFRRLIRDSVVWLNKRYDQYDKLPDSLKHQSLIRSGYAIATVSQPLAEVEYDFDLLCKNIGTCRKDGGALALNADAFSVGVSALSEDRMEAALKKIGVEIQFADFGRVVAFAKHFGTTTNGKTANAVEAYLDEFTKLRNKVAHSGQGVVLTENDIRTAVAFFSVLGPALAASIEEAVETKYT